MNKRQTPNRNKPTGIRALESMVSHSHPRAHETITLMLKLVDIMSTKVNNSHSSLCSYAKCTIKFSLLKRVLGKTESREKNGLQNPEKTVNFLPLFRSVQYLHRYLPVWVRLSVQRMALHSGFVQFLHRLNLVHTLFTFLTNCSTKNWLTKRTKKCKPTGYARKIARIRTLHDNFARKLVYNFETFIFPEKKG